MDVTDYLRFVLALILVVGLIMALSWGLKRLGVGLSNPGTTSRKRLQTVESATIDSRHRLILVRRDQTEHLVLVGPTSSQVIEAGIPAPVGDIVAPEAPPSIGDAIKAALHSNAKT